MSGMAWRDGSEWDPDVDSLTTLVGRHLVAARGTEGRYTHLLVQHFSDGLVLEGREGVDAANGFLDDVQGRLMRLLRRRDGLFMLQALRRVSRRLWVEKHYDPNAFHTRRLAELAVHKYSRWRGVRSNPDDRAFTWSKSDAKDVATAIWLAEAYEAGAAIRRRLAKGQPLQVTRAGSLTIVPHGAEGERRDGLIATLDRRRMSADEPLAFLGQVSTSTESSSLAVLGGKWRPVTDLAEAPWALIEADPGGVPWPPLPAHDLLCWVSSVRGIDELLEATGYLTDWMRRQYRCSVTDVLLVLHLLSQRVMDQVLPQPYGRERLWRYGFACAQWPGGREVASLIDVARERDLPRAAAVSESTLNAALEVVQTAPAALALDTPLHTRPIVRMGDWFAYDALSYGGLLLGLVADARADPVTETLVRRRLEMQTHARLSPLGEQPWPPGKRIRHEGADVTDLDASVVLGDLLVAVDCYSSNWTGALDRGDHAQTRNRVQHLRSKLAEWDATWRRIASGEGLDSLRPGIQGVRRVLPVVVSAIPEWIDEDASSAPVLWFNEGVPRVLTANELAELLVDDAANVRHTIPIR